MKYFVTIRVLAAFVVFCLAEASLESYSACKNYSIPKQLQNKTVSSLLNSYKMHLTKSNNDSAANASSKANNATKKIHEITLLDIISHAMNATINQTLSKMGIKKGCVKYLQLTETESALMHLKDPDKFPGNMNLQNYFDLLITNTTEYVLKDIENIIEKFENQTKILNSTINELTSMGDFTEDSQFFLVLGYALDSISVYQVLFDVDMPLEIVNVTFKQMADYLYMDYNRFRNELSMRSVIKRLQIGKRWIDNVWQYTETQREKFEGVHLAPLFRKNGLNPLNATVLDLLHVILPISGINETYAEFVGMRRVPLKSFNYTIRVWGSVTYESSEDIDNFTIIKFYDSAYRNRFLFEENKKNKNLRMTRKSEIYSKYKIATDDFMNLAFNLTFPISDLSDHQLENYAARWYIYYYAKQRNKTIQELEKVSNITSGKLSNVSVDDLSLLLFQIGAGNMKRAIANEKALNGITKDGWCSLCMQCLRDTINDYWKPLSYDWKILIQFPFSYHFSQRNLNPSEVLNMTFISFVENFLTPLNTSFDDLLLRTSKSLYKERMKLSKEFKSFTFGEFEEFLGLASYEILTWDVRTFITRISWYIINDVDECKKSPCAKVPGVSCVNQPIGYKCICPKNKNLYKNRKCEDINECRLKKILAPNCPRNSHCVNSIGAYKCKCDKGFLNINDTCTDIDECKLKIYTCPRNSTCNNTIGSYICQCNDGYIKTRGQCKDIDECKVGKANCRNNSKCVNTIGSYRCPCDRGFEDNKNGTCVDIDECKLKRRVCDSAIGSLNCSNTIGSYKCVCNPGFRYTDKFKVCVDIDECKEKNPCEGIPHSFCDNIHGNYKCECKKGFTKHSYADGSIANCTDIDECSTGKHRCDKNAICTNNNGSYSCSCFKDYKGDGKNCKAQRLYEAPPGIKVIKLKQYFIKFRPPADFYYDGKMHDHFYIVEDPYIPIGKRYISGPKELTSLRQNVIAPFWVWTNYRFDSSSVTYFLLEEDDKNATPLLEKINSFVRNSTNETSFESSWVFIITWKKMTPFLPQRTNPKYRSEKITLQCVLASDGRKTVTIFIYDEMNWRLDLNRLGSVGYSFKSGKGYQLVQSFKPEIFRINKDSFTDPAGNVRQGLIVYVFKETKQEKPSPEEECYKWIKKERKVNMNWLNGLQDCPCDRSQSRFDLRFMSWSNRDNVACVINRPGRRRRGPAKTCCFNSFGGLISGPDTRAGRVYRYGPWDQTNYLTKEVEPYSLCCEQSTKHCRELLKLRPLEKGCSRRRRRRRPGLGRLMRGFMFGDPHFTTLDGFKYTFNGLGDYVIVKTKDNENYNAIHTRTKRAKSKDGSLSKATVFYGFALRSSKNTTVQVFYDSSKTHKLAITTVNQSMNCEAFGFADIEKHPIDGFNLVNQSNTLAVVFDSGLTAEITPGSDLLQFSLSVPTSNFENRTEGLLGILNGEKNDDLTLRNGESISINSTDKEIFKFGKNWTVHAEERIFVNTSTCQLTDVYTSNFEPVFLSDVQDKITPEMRASCKENKECLLDYFATNDSSFASATLQFETANNKIKKLLENNPPEITTYPEEPKVIVGQNITIQVMVSDPDNDQITFLMADGISGLNAVFVNTTPTFGNLTWVPSAGLQKININFIARDSNGATTVHNLGIKYCDCNNNSCEFGTVQKSYQNSSLELVACNCAEQYTGNQCQTPVNPCDDEPCFGNITCTMTTNPFGYKCGPCPEGLEGNGVTCTDFDECENSSRNNCTDNEKCTNKIGSYKCDCKPGFRRNPQSKKCVDENECKSPSLPSYKCKANTDCQNTEGGYNCSCKTGYKGNPLEGCTDINECQGADRICYGAKCENTPGSYNCSCSKGYTLKKEGNTFSCKDDDECQFRSDNNCDQQCINTGGSYECGCSQGFQLASDGRSCKVGNSSKCDGSNGGCESLCTNSSGVVTCHCHRGYNISSDGKNCDDINECANDNGGCSQLCNNKPGSYNCYCRDGYKLNGQRSCKDVNECLTNNGGCSQKCLNKLGGRECRCKKGYSSSSSDNVTCTDINECEDINICGQYRECENARGGFSCRCKDKTLFSDGKFKCKKSRKLRLKCRIVSKPWDNDYYDKHSEKSKILKEEIENSFGSFFKGKFKNKFLGLDVQGFEPGSVQANLSLNFDSNTTVTASDVSDAVANTSNIGGLTIDPSASEVSDIDECSDSSLNNCHKDATCKNEPGTFTCTCKDGYQGDGVNCEASPIPKEEEKDDKERRIMIILLSTLIPLAVIIIIIICCCCVKRSKKGHHQMNNTDVQMYHTSSHVYGSQREVHYDNQPRRNSNHSSNYDDYDMARPPSTTFGKDVVYDTTDAQCYDNPGLNREKSGEELHAI